MSDSPKLIDKTYDQGADLMKPKGLWYSFSMGKPKSSWLHWVYEEMPEWIYKYDYFLEIDVSSANIKKIETKEQVFDFHDKYSVKDKYSPDFGNIDWSEVAQDYDGIEIVNPKSVLSSALSSGPRNKSMWVYGWDIDSGCVWNTQNVKVVKVKPKEIRQQERGAKKYFQQLPNASAGTWPRESYDYMATNFFNRDEDAVSGGGGGGEKYSRFRELFSD